MPPFRIHSPYRPAGDQPKAIEQLVRGLEAGMPRQVLMGVTGSGKTFTMAGVIERTQRPALVIAHNKTLAAQLCNELRELFPENAVEYFVSYYDYYQPEAYIPATDTYIEKESDINDEIDRMRHSATASLLERRDVIVVASVSCIYSLGDPREYSELGLSLRPGMTRDRDEIIARLVDMQYERNDVNFVRGAFRARGDVLEIYPASYTDNAIRVEFFGDEIERISQFDVVTGRAQRVFDHVMIFPASHYAASRERIERAIRQIEADLAVETAAFEAEGKLLEAQRLAQRTRYDIEMMREIGYCSGIENYSRYFDGRAPGQPSYSLLDFFPKDYLLFIDESHVTVSQIQAMYAGDRSRKDMLVQFGFRLRAAYDNRPLTFEEFEERMGQTIYVSATPGPFERGCASQIVEQIVRPTGLVDPEIIVRPVSGQVDDLIGEIRRVTERGFRVLVTTLTKKMAENLTDYLAQLSIRVRYLHSDIDTLERMEILRDLRAGEFDVLVGINLLREGLDLPEVALVAVLDADKEGFLRSETSLIQTVGRAARNVEGRVLFYADTVTRSMKNAIDETNRRRALQQAYNREHGITPRSIRKAVSEPLAISRAAEETGPVQPGTEYQTLADRIAALELEMKEAAARLDFERAAVIRDEIKKLNQQ
ncbi:MAG: excinuclease ABC subunit UvrB [Christensenellales bacterium]